MDLSVKVEAVRWPKATDTGNWYILKTTAGIAKGNMAWRPRDGEPLVLIGEWTVYQGSKEFSFRSARLDIPSHPRDQLHYVIERTGGAGRIMEDAIWAAAGESWKTIQPGVVRGLGGALYERFRLQVEALDMAGAQAQVVAALVGKGATDRMAQEAWIKWKEETLGVVNADPFRLAELPGYGFSHVDRGIRQNYGIADADPRRVRAAVVHTLRRLTDRGDTVVPWESLFTNACAALGGMDDLVLESARELLADGTLKNFPGLICLSDDFAAESTIWEFAS